jgi:hypothetical protein
MPWIIAVALLIVALLIRFGHRKSALGLAVGVVALGTWLYVHNERQEHAAENRIPVSDIALNNVNLRPTFRSGYDLVGTLRNNSPRYRLDGIDVSVTLRDCRTKDNTNCTVIGQASTYVAITVPSGESRDLVASLHFGDDKPEVKGTLAWDYKIVSATANRQ